jgi:spore coat polysaccharide biosynthesis protein SpsF
MKATAGKLRIHESVDVNQMLDLMLRSQIGICAASSVAYEYCCAGGGLFVIKTADNQNDCHRFLLSDHLAEEYSIEEIQLISLGDIQLMIATQKKIFNGQSIKNLKALFNYYLVKDQIYFRSATENDSKTYFDWANDPDVRMNSINKSKIEWDSHEAWFRNKVTNPHSKLFLFSYEKKHIGQLRLDLVEGNWLISFSIDRESRGKGFAEIIVYKAIIAFKEEWNEPFTLKAQVQEDNIPSLKVFQHLGFIEGPSEDLYGHQFRNFYKASR